MCVCVVRVIDQCSRTLHNLKIFESSFAASTLKRFPGHIFWRLRATVFDANQCKANSKLRKDKFLARLPSDAPSCAPGRDCAPFLL